MSQLSLVRAANQVWGRLAPDAAARAARRLFMTPGRHDPRPWETAAEQRGERVRLGNGLSAIRWGEGPAVFALHGWEGRATQWAGFVEPLAARGLSVVALDGPAHGRSPGTETHAIDFAYAALAADRELGPFAGAIGHSMGGGAIGVALARGLRAERAVLIAPPSSIANVIDRFARLVALPPAAARRFAARIEERVGLPAADIEIRRLAAGVRAPGLVIHDRGDVEVPFEDGEAIARAWRGARLLAVEGLGHRRVLRDPAVVAAAVAFLAGEPGAAGAVDPNLAATAA